MFFGKKNIDGVKCDNCRSKINEKYKFCPHCGIGFTDPKKEREDFGLLGRGDIIDQGQEGAFPSQNFGITDKILSSLFNNLMRTLDKQLKDQMMTPDKDFGKAEIKSFPNGIGIKIYGPFDQAPRRQRREQIVQKVDDSQIKRMSGLPREKAKANVKRLGDKVIYELSAYGINSIDDVFVSKIETGYEIKAIGNKKVYINNIPINLPLKKYSISKDKLLFEFVAKSDL